MVVLKTVSPISVAPSPEILLISVVDSLGSRTPLSVETTSSMDFGLGVPVLTPTWELKIQNSKDQ
ncbi:hypothetical protein [Chryseobacterium sp. c4a]|uniref:hypothetical protein n=1 Tax=Chryseobacterium sp. c4a TaxID=1573582 RepID=UPI00135BA56C|nr:hypothetical protein [Chryseobacterium sp. c4a]